MQGEFPARAVGAFHEGQPTGSLGEAFSAVWVHRFPANTAPPIVICPDATIDLQWIEGSWRVAGPDLEPKVEELAPGAVVVGFRFRPAAASAWLGISASDIVGMRVPLKEIWGRRARHLTAAARGSSDGPNLITRLETAVANEAFDCGDSAVMRAAFGLVSAGPPPGAPLIPWLARSMAMSERTLRRRFHESFGYGPKTLDRILRYQRFLRLAENSQEPAASLALEAGYSDQAHLIREAKRLSGFTPKAWMNPSAI